MPRHHIIPRHEWKARFGSLSGFNAHDNQVDLYTDQHAQVHMHYFNEITHIEYDRIASLFIACAIGKEETYRLVSSATMKGRKLSAETRAKMPAAKKGNKYSIGRKVSETTRAKLSIASMGKNRKPFTIVTKARMSAARVRKVFSLEHRRKLSEASRGNKSACKGVSV